MLSVIVKVWKFFCIRFRFVLWNNKLTRFCLFNFLAVSHAAKKKYQFLVFLQVICIKLSSFCWYFFNIWPFIYWTLNKQSFETWSCVCCYCAYGLFLCFRSLWNISWKRQEIWGGSRTVRCRSQWVNKVLDITNKNLHPGQNYSKMYGIEPWYNEPRYSEFLNITNIIQKPKGKIYLDIMNYNVKLYVTSDKRWTDQGPDYMSRAGVSLLGSQQVC